MKCVPIGGLKVDFPEYLTPFPAQLALMSKVIAALKRGQNALLGSPTGTGKTLVRRRSGWRNRVFSYLVLPIPQRSIIHIGSPSINTCVAKK